MRCARVKGLLSDYLDGLLDVDRAALVEKHLAQCEKCRNELESLRALVRELGSLEPMETPVGFLADLHTRLEKDTWLVRLKSLLSVPARIRLPMELATLTATLVIAFFVFHIIPFSQPLESTVSRQEKLDFSTASPAAESTPVSKTVFSKSTDFEDVQAPMVALSPSEKSVSSMQADESKKSLRKDNFLIGKETVSVPASEGGLQRTRSAQNATEPGVKSVRPAPAAPGGRVETKSLSDDLQAGEGTTAVQEPAALCELEKTKEEAVKTSAVCHDPAAVETPPVSMVLHIAGFYDKSKPALTDNRETIPGPDAVKKQETQPPPTAAAGSGSTRVKTEKGVSKNKAAPAAAGYLRPMILPQPEADAKAAAGEIRLQIEKIVLKLEGKISATEQNRKSGQPEFLSLEIPARHFETLVAKLKELGTLEAPAVEGISVGSGLQTVRVRLHLRTQP